VRAVGACFRSQVTHARFVKRKDRTRLRVPVTEAAQPAPPVPRLDLSRGKNGPIRPRAERASSTALDLARGQGLVWVHALGRGAPGRDGDLERSRRQLLARNPRGSDPKTQPSDLGLQIFPVCGNKVGVLDAWMRHTNR